MRILFIGSVELSAAALKKLIDLKANVVAVACKEKSDFNADFADLSQIADGANIPYKFVKDINHENNVAWIVSHQPEIIFCFGWSSLLGDQILKLPRLGVVGFHPAMLPENRGRHPLIWAKFLGLKKTGTTFFFMDGGADTGDILSQREMEIDFEDDARSLYEKMTENALSQIEEFLPTLIAETYKRRPQGPDDGNAWRKRGPSDGLIDFRMTTFAICNLVRALTRPYAGAHCLVSGKEVKVWRIEPGNCDSGNVEPGKVLNLDGSRIEVKTYDGSVVLIEHEFSFKPKMGEYLI